MYFDEVYEEVTESEANFMISLYESVKSLLSEDKDVTLVRLSGMVHVSAKELCDYLPTIIQMVDEAKEQLGK